MVLLVSAHLPSAHEYISTSSTPDELSPPLVRYFLRFPWACRVLYVVVGSTGSSCYSTKPQSPWQCLESAWVSAGQWGFSWLLGGGEINAPHVSQTRPQRPVLLRLRDSGAHLKPCLSTSQSEFAVNLLYNLEPHSTPDLCVNTGHFSLLTHVSPGVGGD